MLEAENLTKTYAAVPAVENVNFALASGEILGCLGPNGSGKSTTVKMLTGLLEPSRGRVAYCGGDIHKDLVGFRRCLGYVPEEPNLYSYLSGYEYLEMVGLLREMPQARIRRRAEAMLELFSLYPSRHGAMASYSKGMRQRILVIAALLDDPEILILDEPMSGLDVTSASILKNLIRVLGQQGKAIFYCSHVLEVVEQVCSHVLILRRGQVIAYDTIGAIQNAAEHTSLESRFMHLVEAGDTEKAARDIVSAMSAA
jgi:ABC-2 type transport system ATP-binding protein